MSVRYDRGWDLLLALDKGVNNISYSTGGLRLVI